MAAVGLDHDGPRVNLAILSVTMRILLREFESGTWKYEVRSQGAPRREAGDGGLRIGAELIRFPGGCQRGRFGMLVRTESSGVEGNVVDAAVAERVTHVVKLSVISAEAPAINFARWHNASEQKLKASGRMVDAKARQLHDERAGMGSHHQDRRQHLPADRHRRLGRDRPGRHRGCGGPLVDERGA